MDARPDVPPCHLPANAETAGKDGVQRERELWAAVILGSLAGLGRIGRKALLETFGSAADAMASWRQWGDAGIREEAIRMFRGGSWEETAAGTWSRIASHGCRFLLLCEAEYPEYLRRMTDAPLVLFYEGRTELLRNPGFAVVGSRRCGADGRLACRKLAGSLSDAGVTVVSGLAGGIDAQAHEAAVEGRGGTIAVMGTGLELTYPAKNAKLRQKIAERGLVLTEFAPGAPLEAVNFPIRNRIIAGLSQGVLVVEASEKSGSLITARIAAENGRPVYAAPGRCGSPLSSGCARLLRQGATPVLAAQDILADLPQDEEAGKDGGAPQAGSGLEERIVNALKANGPIHIDRIAGLVGESAGSVSSALLLLEMDGTVTRFPGMVYGV